MVLVFVLRVVAATTQGVKVVVVAVVVQVVGPSLSKDEEDRKGRNQQKVVLRKEGKDEELDEEQDEDDKDEDGEGGGEDQQGTGEDTGAVDGEGSGVFRKLLFVVV